MSVLHNLETEIMSHPENRDRWRVRGAKRLVNGREIAARLILPEGRAFQGRRLAPRFNWYVDGERVSRSAAEDASRL